MKQIISQIRDNLRRRGLDIVRVAPDSLCRRLDRRTWEELRRLETAADRSIHTTNLMGPPLRIVSNRAFSCLYREIILREIYRFETDNRSPLILDCGANIGVSALYFRQLFPKCRLICFEPDPQVFSILQENVAAFRLEDVELLNQGVWMCDDQLRFETDPQSTAGHLTADKSEAETASSDTTSSEAASSESIEVQVTRLRPYLEQPVDFLKIDIEGAETTVLEDCREVLPNVQQMFVEYHSRGDAEQSLHRLTSILHDAGFRIYLEQGGKKSEHPFVDRANHKGWDLLLDIYAYRDDA